MHSEPMSGYWYSIVWDNVPCQYSLLFCYCPGIYRLSWYMGYVYPILLMYKNKMNMRNGYQDTKKRRDICARNGRTWDRMREFGQVLPSAIGLTGVDSWAGERRMESFVGRIGDSVCECLGDSRDARGLVSRGSA